MQNTQRMVVAHAYVRREMESSQRQLAELTQARLHEASEASRLRQERDRFHCDLDHCKEDLTRIRGERDSAKAGQKGAEEQLALKETAFQALEGERNHIAGVAHQWKAHAEASDARIAELTQQLEAMDLQAARAAAVREFRASREHYEEKMDFGVGFKKYGFYMARAYLESLHPDTQYPELIFGPAAEDIIVPDWRQLGDPDSTAPEAFLDVPARELEKPAGPWTPLYLPAEGAGEQDRGAEGQTQTTQMATTAQQPLPLPDSGEIGALDDIEFTMEGVDLD